jgi:hypothetical protein
LTSQNDTKHGTATLPVSDDAWRFLSAKMDMATKDTHAADLISLHLCFGEVFGVGLPKRSGRPSRTNPTTYAHRGDNVNILHLSNDNGDDVMDNGEDIFHERTAAQGIDFYYDEAAGTLRLRVRYSSHVISDEVMQQVLLGAGINVVGELDNIAPFRIGALLVCHQWHSTQDHQSQCGYQHG